MWTQKPASTQSCMLSSFIRLVGAGPARVLLLHVCASLTRRHHVMPPPVLGLRSCVVRITIIYFAVIILSILLCFLLWHNCHGPRSRYYFHSYFCRRQDWRSYRALWTVGAEGAGRRWGQVSPYPSVAILLGCACTNIFSLAFGTRMQRVLISKTMAQLI